MFRKFNLFCTRILVDYQAINDLVIGTICLIYTIYTLEGSDSGFIRKSFQYFLSVMSILMILKSFLLLYAIRRGHKKCIFVYLILTTVLLLLAIGFVINEGIQMNKTVTEVSQIKGLQEYKIPLRRNFIFVYAIFFPLIFTVNWIVQFYVYLFYRSLTPTVEIREASETLMENVYV